MPQDDAPNATSKHAHGDREVAARAVTINRPAQEVYDFFRDLTKAPLYMEDIERVDVNGTHAHWVAKDAEWDAEIINDVPGKELTWKTVSEGPGSSGRAAFQEIEGRGTVVTLTMAYEQPGGIIGKVIGKLKQTDPVIQSRRNLRRLKQLLETGETATNARNRQMLAEENN